MESPAQPRPRPASTLGAGVTHTLPPGLIRSGVDTLVENVVPAHRTRRDSLEELVVARD